MRGERVKKKILITGGTGSLGQGLIAHWKDRYELRILSRNPHQQQMVQEKFGLEPSAFVLADVCDYEAVKAACAGVDVLIHAAALKVVNQGEQNPEEYHRVNTIGSQVVARAWFDAEKSRDPADGLAARLPRKALYINSDKAIAPTSLYGCSKKMGEAFFIKRGFSSLRYGNVVGSEGSFIHKWVEYAEKGRAIPVRYPHPTRFFLSFAEAFRLINCTLAAIDVVGNGIFVPAGLPSFDVYSVAKAFTNPLNICQRGLEPGEKRHEVLLQPGEVAEKIPKEPALFKVEPGWRGGNNCFSSEFAPRIGGDEVLRRLGVSPRQEVFA